MRVHSARGVVAPGAPLLDLVPKGERLIVEAQISPADVDVVHADLPAEVQFTGLKTGYSAPVMGSVQSVSADRLTDERTGATYFLARVEIDDALDGLDGTKLTPGMPAQVMIITGRRTPLGYLISPLTQSFEKALREE
jgi:multidrug efflux pump subunit AcrA (membrane-fusion protein)